MIRVSIILSIILTLSTAVAAQVVLTPPELVGQVATPDDVFEVVLNGDVALVPDYGAGVEFISIADPTTPVIIGSYNTPGFAVQCDIAGSLVYVADHGNGGLQILNMAAPSGPWRVGQYRSGDIAVMAAWHNGIVLVGYVERRIDLIDVTTPSAPSLISSFATTGVPRHAIFDGPYAFVADYTDGLIILDISTPSAPVQVGGIAASRPLGIDRVGSTLFLACSNGLRTIDISNPDSPVALDRVGLPGPAVKVQVVGNVAFVADHVAGGLQVIDVSNPADLTVTTSYVTGEYSHGVASAGDYAYLADGGSLKVFRVFDSSVPVQPTSFGRLKAKYRPEPSD